MKFRNATLPVVATLALAFAAASVNAQSTTGQADPPQ